MPSSETSFSREVLATGIAPEARESGVEGRDAIQELHDDLAVHLMLIAHARERVAQALARLEEKEGNEELKRTLYAAQEEIARFEQRFFAVGAQAELFATEEIKTDQHESVKLMQFRKLRDDFREWWNVSAGIKNLFSRVTHEFEDVKDFPKAVFAKDDRERSQWYSRGFTKEVSLREQELAHALKAQDVALFNSGMSAIETILELEELKKGDTVVAANHFYLHTGFLMDALAKRGVKVIRVPSGNLTALTDAIARHHPKLVLSEVVSNAPEMEVIPVRELFAFLGKYNGNPKLRNKARLVLDNTFLTPELLDLLQEAEKTPDREHLPLTVVESATKYYQHGLDNVTAGIVYANDPAYLQNLKRKRAMIGTHLQEQLAAYIPPVDAQALEIKMLRHSSNARLLAEALAQNPHLKVSYPSVESHPDRERAKELMPLGAGGLFYFEWNHPNIPAEDAVNRVRALAKDRGVDIRIGVSFGHPQTWLETIRLPGTQKDAPQYIRVATGEENIADFKKVVAVFQEALS